MKKISMGNWITIFIVLGNFVWMIGIMSKDVANVQETANTALKMAHYNDKQIVVMINGLNNIEKILIRNGH